MGDMSSSVPEPDDLRGLDPYAARAVGFADREARELGHERVGTEHLLLGLLTNDSDASKMLSNAGVTLAAARTKVSEAVGNSSAGTTGVSGPLPRTARTGRALGRAARFAHAEGSDVVTSDHLLWGVLDVEGTAGQVLRGLGVDVDSLRGRREAQETDAVTEAPRSLALDSHSAACPSCGVALEANVAARVVAAATESGIPHDAILFSCESCGRFLGVAPA